MGVAILLELGAVCALTSAPLVELSDRSVRVRDVATLDCLEPAQRERIGSQAIAALPPHAQESALTREALVALARRRAPALGSIETGEGAARIVLRAPASNHQASDSTCHSAARVIGAGETISSEMLAPAPCVARANDALHYDRVHSAPRAARAIAEGEHLGRIAAAT